MRTRFKSQKLLESLGGLVTNLEVPLAITLVTITTFKPETLVEMSVENQELSLQMLLQDLRQVFLLTMDSFTILVEMSVEIPELSLQGLRQVLLLTMDQDLITILV